MSDMSMVNLGDIAAKVRAVQPRALTTDQYTDVVTCIEWMQQEIVRRHDELDKREQQVAFREKSVLDRETRVALRGAVFGAAHAMQVGRLARIKSYLRR